MCGSINGTGSLLYIFHILHKGSFRIYKICNTILFIFMRFFLGGCSPDQITCKDGQCIGKKHWLCDGDTCPYNKCDDNSDEDQQICGIVP